MTGTAQQPQRTYRNPYRQPVAVATQRPRPGRRAGRGLRISSTGRWSKHGTGWPLSWGPRAILPNTFYRADAPAAGSTAGGSHHTQSRFGHPGDSGRYHRVRFPRLPGGPDTVTVWLHPGAGSELPFAIGRYKRFGISRYAISGFLGAFLIFWFSAIRSGWFGQDILLLRLVIHCGSGIILGGILAYFLVRAIKATGVVDNYAIGRQR